MLRALLSAAWLAHTAAFSPAAWFGAEPRTRELYRRHGRLSAASADAAAAATASRQDAAAAAAAAATAAVADRPPPATVPPGGEGRPLDAIPPPAADGRPLDELEPVVGAWLELSGNYVLLPPPAVAPRALVHFLGGAFVGAAPHLTYRHLLESLAEHGFVVVTTPYRLGFDYLTTCDSVLQRFELAAVPLAMQFGALPVIGVGHSCGALLHALITSLFPDTPRGGNALISFNNRPAAGAIPLLEEVVKPAAAQIMSPGAAGLREAAASAFAAAGELAEAAAGAAPVPPGAGGDAKAFRADLAVAVRQGLAALEQLPELVEAIAGGTCEFTPSPSETREAVRLMYRARKTLLLKFDDDTLDESEEIYALLQESRENIKLRRPMVDVDIRLEVLRGTHVSPLSPDVVPAGEALVPAGLNDVLRMTLGTDKVVASLTKWLDEVS